MLKHNITFFYMTEYQKDYVGYFVESVKKWMPEANLVQFTDHETPAVPGVDQVVRFTLDRPYEYQYHPDIVIKCLTQSPFDEMISVDADMIFTGSVLDLMEGDYDVAICNRHTRDCTSKDLRYYHPYNGGFMIHKSRAFLNEWHQRTIGKIENKLKISDEDFGFLKGQQVLAELIESGKYKVRILNGQIYNRTPKTKDEKSSLTKVWHFKGDKKK